MKKLLFLILLVTIFILCGSLQHFNGFVTPSVASAKKELIFLNWSEYIDPDLVKEFEAKFNARVREVYYETDELKEEMLLSTNGTGYDVVLGSGISIIPYRKRNWIVPLDATNVPNLKHIDSQWLNVHPRINGYAVPYMWGTLGIAYRQDLIGEKVVSWKQLFNPAEHLRKKIIMIKDSHDTIGAGLKALGYSLNSEDLHHHQKVEQMLLAQKPYVKAYSYVALNEESVLVTGDAWMAMVYNGDALTLQDVHPDIAYTVPEEGTNLWVDYLVVMQASKNKQLAMDFINFLHEPENAARLSSYLMFATPNKTAEKYLSPEHLKNTAIYPQKSILAKSEVYAELSPRTLKKRNSIFAKVIQ